MLLSLWLFVVVTAAAVAWLAGWAAMEMARRRRPRSAVTGVHGLRLGVARAVAAVMTVALSAAAVADGLNRHYSYIPSFAALFGNISPDLVTGSATRRAQQLAAGPDGVHLDHGIVEKHEVPGPVSHIEARTTYVYLPSAYFEPAQADRRFPVLYLIHGSPGTSADWLRGGYVDRTMDELIRRNRIDPFIVVLPDVNGGYRRDVECQDVARGPQTQTYLTVDMVSWVDRTYRTQPDRADRAIGGLSTGGYCGINLAFRHPDVYSAAVSHSGYGRPDHNAYTGDLFGRDNALADANTPDRYLPTVPITQPMGVYLDAGQADAESRRESQTLYDVLRARGVTTTLEIVKGESHDFVAFRRNLNLSLPWVSTWFAAEGAGSGRTEVAAPDTSYLPPPSPTDIAPAPRPCRATAGSTTAAGTRHRLAARRPTIITSRQSAGSLPATQAACLAKPATSQYRRPPPGFRSS